LKPQPTGDECRKTTTPTAAAAATARPSIFGKRYSEASRNPAKKNRIRGSLLSRLTDDTCRRPSDAFSKTPKKIKNNSPGNNCLLLRRETWPRDKPLMHEKFNRREIGEIGFRTPAGKGRW
jgi:hypothetical protein